MLTRLRQRKMHSLMFWLRATEETVLSSFAELDGAKRIGAGDEQFVFVEGTRKDRVVLVAHADSVFHLTRSQ